MKRKIGFSILGLLVLAIVGLIVGPRLINWNNFTPQIAELVYEEIGKELSIDGDIELTLLPSLTFRVTGIRIVEPAFETKSPLAAIKEVSGEIGLLSLLFGELDVQSFIISEPEIALEVSEEGDTNWRLYVSRPVEDSEQDAWPSRPLPVAIAALDNVRIDNGRVEFRDQRTGQDIVAVDLKSDVSLADRAAPLLIEGGTTVNGKAVSWTFDVTTLADLEAGHEAKITGALKTEFLNLDTALNLDLEPPFDLNGDVSLKATSIGNIANWLDLPLEEDPGSVKIKATFRSEVNQKTALTAVLEGKDLNATLSGDLDLGTAIPTASFKLEGTVLDFTRYLPAPADNKLAPSVGREDSQINIATASKKFSQPLELAFLKEMDATFEIKLEKIITHRLTIGPITANGALQKGNLTAKVTQLSLYGGTLSGSVALSEKDGNASLTVNGSMKKIPFDKIGEGLALETLPVSGVGNGSLSFTSEGPTILLLAQNARFDLDLVLTPITDKSKNAMITAAKISLAREKLRGPAELDGTLNFKGRQVKLSGNARPKGTPENLTGMDFKAKFQSELATLNIEGARDLSDTPKAHATLEFKATSAQNFANWISARIQRKADNTAADPISITGDVLNQNKITTIEKLRFSGPLVDIEATGKIDRFSDTPSIALDLKGDVFDIDRLLALLPKAPAGPEQPGKKEKQDDAFVAFLPDQALDLSDLQTFDMDLKLHLNKTVFEDIEIGPLTATSSLKDGKFDTKITALQFEGSDLTADLAFDTKPALYDFKARLNIADWKGDAVPLTRDRVTAFEKGSTGQGDFTARGRTPRDLMASLSGRLTLSIPGITLTGTEIAEFSQTSIDLVIPESPNTLELKAKSTIILGENKIELPVTAYLKSGRLISLVQDSDMPIDLSASFGDSKISVLGKITDARTAPKAILELDFEAPSLTAYGMLIKDLPDVAPVNAKAKLVADQKNISLTEVAGRLGASDMAGELTVSLAGSPRDIQGSLTSNLIDLSPFLPDQPEPTTETKTKKMPPATGDNKYLFKDTPLPVQFLAEYNADMALDIKKLKVSPVMELNNVTGNILLKDKVLSIDPMHMEKGSGTISTKFKFDTTSEVPKMAYSTTVSNLEVVVTEDARVRLNSHSDLTSTGNSPRKLASNLNGRTDWISRDGEIDDNLFGFLSFGAGNIFSTFLGGKESAAIDCLAIRFDIKDGLVDPVVAMVDTGDLVIAGSGDINLKDETLTLTIGTSARTVGVADLVVPILVTGTLSSPRVIPNPGAGTRNLGAGILRLINPVNAVDTVFGTDIRGGNKPPCALAFDIVADTKAPADLTLTKKQATNSGLIGGTVKGVGNILESVGSGIRSLFGGNKESSGSDSSSETD